MSVTTDGLFDKITTQFRASIKAKYNTDPFAQAQPQYSQQFFRAVSQGLVEHTREKLLVDIVLTGTAGIVIYKAEGIVFNPTDFSQKLYTNIRAKALTLGSGHAPWPPPEGNSGETLRLFTDAIAQGTHDEWLKWEPTFNSPVFVDKSDTKPMVNWRGIDPNILASKIQSAGGLLRGAFWPQFCQAVSSAYCDTIFSIVQLAKYESGDKTPPPTPSSATVTCLPLV